MGMACSRSRPSGWPCGPLTAPAGAARRVPCSSTTAPCSAASPLAALVPPLLSASTRREELESARSLACRRGVCPHSRSSIAAVPICLQHSSAAAIASPMGFRRTHSSSAPSASAAHSPPLAGRALCGLRACSTTPMLTRSGSTPSTHVSGVRHRTPARDGHVDSTRWPAAESTLACIGGAHAVSRDGSHGSSNVADVPKAGDSSCVRERRALRCWRRAASWRCSCSA